MDLASVINWGLSHFDYEHVAKPLQRRSLPIFLALNEDFLRLALARSSQTRIAEVAGSCSHLLLRYLCELISEGVNHQLETIGHAEL
jgi:hypothetical protein